MRQRPVLAILGCVILAMTLTITLGCVQKKVVSQPSPAAGQQGYEDRTERDIEELKARLAKTDSQIEAIRGGQPEVPGGSQWDSLLAQEEGRKKQSEDRARGLVDNYVQNARNLLGEMEIEKAKAILEKAVGIMPDHEEARQLLADVRMLLGEYAPTDAGERAKRLVDEMRVKMEQHKIELNNKFQQGVRAHDAEQYDEAIDCFQKVLEWIRWYPDVIDLSYYQTQAEGYLARSKAGKKRKDAELAVEREEAARKRADDEEQQRKKDLAERVITMFRRAQTEFENQRYESSRQICEEILYLDPRNEYASKLRDVAVIAGIGRNRTQILERYKEEWRRTINAAFDKLVSQSEVVEFPSREEWKKVCERKIRGIAVGAEEESDEDRRTKRKIADSKISLSFSDTSLTDMVSYLREYTGLNIMIDMKGIADPDSIRITAFKVDDLVLEKALDIILRMLDLTYRIKDGVVMITTVAAVATETVLELYDVQDLTVTIMEFPGKEISLIPPEEGMGVSTTDVGAAPPVIVGDELKELIKNTIAKETWDEEGGRSIEYNNGLLIVRHTPQVHEQIRRMLSDIRQSTGVVVTIETRFLSVRETFLEDIGVDFRGLNPVLLQMNEFSPFIGEGVPDDSRFDFMEDPFDLATETRFPSPGIWDRSGGHTPGQPMVDRDIRARIEHVIMHDATLQTFLTTVVNNTGGGSFSWAIINDVSVSAIMKALAKDQRTKILTAPSLTVYNTQRANIMMATQYAYVKDYDMQVAASAVVADPVPAVVQDGIVLDVRPTVSADRKYITLELRPTVATLLNPISDGITTFLGIGGGVAVIRTIETPNMQVQRVRTTATIPDGGTLLLGGLTTVNNIQYESKVPFLGDLPIFSFLLSRKISGSQQDCLLILLRAKITIMEDEERYRGLDMIVPR
jgi:type II secretory pathway component GspD/PulD (secretin)